MKIHVCFVGLILLLCFCTSIGQVQEGEILNQYVDWSNSPSENANIYQLCGVLGAKGIPIGIEESVSSDASRYDRIVRVENGTLREILDSLVKQEKEYSWEIRNGAINIYPAQARDGVLKSFLETRVTSFILGKGEGRVAISQRIKNLGSIRSFLDSRTLVLSISTLPDVLLDNTTGMHAEETDLRGVLNEIIKTRPESKRWLIKRLENGEIHLLF